MNETNSLLHRIVHYSQKENGIWEPKEIADGLKEDLEAVEFEMKVFDYGTMLIFKGPKVLAPFLPGDPKIDDLVSGLNNYIKALKSLVRDHLNQDYNLQGIDADLIENEFIRNMVLTWLEQEALKTPGDV